MKTTKLCLKCHSSDVIIVPGNVEAYGIGNNIRTGMTVFSAIPVNRYVCCGCGFTEEWVDTEDISKLKKKYGE